MEKTFSELIRERQSCRNFSDRTVDLNLIYEIVKEATLSPSACNSQPWHVFITNTPEENGKMKACLQESGVNGFLDNAKAFVAIYEKDTVRLKERTELKFSADHFVKYDIGEFIAYLTLSAKDKGLDSCIIGWVNGSRINEQFGIQGTCNIVVALGYANDDTVRRKSRLDLDEVIINKK